MKLDKLLLALLVISVVLFAVPASVYADDNNSSGSGDDDEDENENEENGSDDEPECSVDADCDSDEVCASNFECEDVEDEESEILSCTDSDNGKNYYEKGITIMKTSGSEVTSGSADSCTGPTPNDVCPLAAGCGDTQYVTEWFCNTDGTASPETYECPNGCHAGACIKDEESESEVEDETEIEDESELEVEDEDVSITKYNHGMEVRLLQLQKSVVKHITVGKLILEEIDNQNFSVDTDNLENYLDDMNDLNDRITAELAKDPVNVTTEEFVAMKHEAIKITFQFKAELYDILTPEQLKIVKDAIKDKVKIKGTDELKIEEKFKLKVKEYNKEVALKMLEKFGEDNEELKAKIMAGELGAKELKVELREEYKNLGEARKNQLKLKIEEEKSKQGKEKLELEAKVKGLNRSEVANIVRDSSLTLEEKQAKIRVLVQEHKAENPTCYNGVLDADESNIDCGGNCMVCFKGGQGQGSGKGPSGSRR